MPPPPARSGHERLRPARGPCPKCGDVVRLWKCQAAGCAELLYDDEHVHDEGKFGRSRR